MVQKTIKALYKQPVNYKLIKDGYKTVNGVIQAQDGMPKVVDFSVPSELYITDLQYDVNTEVNGAPIITTKQFTLPDDEICEAKQYCLAPKGMSYTYSEKQEVEHSYIDTASYTIVGSPTVDTTSGIVTNFSNSSYLVTGKRPSGIVNSYEVVLKFKTSSFNNGRLIGNYTSNIHSIQIEVPASGENTVWWGHPSSAYSWQAINPNYIVEPNTWYWIKGVYDSSTSKLTVYMHKENEDYINCGELSVTGCGWNEDIEIGCDQGKEGATGAHIDLSESYIKINGDYWWKPWIRETKIEEVTTQIPGILDSSVTTDDWQQNQDYKLYQLKNQDNTDSLQLTENSITNNNQRYTQYINQITIPARDYKWYYHGIPQGYYEEFYYNGDVSVDNKIATFTDGMVEFNIRPRYYYSPFTTVMQFETSDNVSNQSLMKIVNSHYNSSVSEYEEKCIYFSCIHNGKFSITNDENLENFNDGLTLLPNTKYWLAIYLYQNGVDTYLLTDDKYSKYSLPPLSSWNKQISLAFSYMIDIVDNEWTFGQYMDTNQVSILYPPFVGKLYLENCIAFNELNTSYDQFTWEAYHYYNYEYKWMANKSLYKNIENTNTANVLDFSDSYINVSQYTYNQYENPQVCLMPIDGGETDDHLYTIGDKGLHGCLYNYDDDGSEHSFDVYYDSNHTQPILVSSGETYYSGTKVDTITLPQHNVWTYQAGGIWTKIIP